MTIMALKGGHFYRRGSVMSQCNVEVSAVGAYLCQLEHVLSSICLFFYEKS